MHLGRIHVENFRNLENLDVRLGPGLNVLVGENNVGKTNLLHAIRLALPSPSGGDVSRLGPEDRTRGPDGTFKAAPIRVDLHFLGLSAHERSELLEVLNYDPVTPDASTASIHFEWTWSERAKRPATRRWAGDRPVAEAIVPEDVTQAIPVILLTALRDAEQALLPGRRSRLGRLLAASASDPDRKALEELVRRTNAEIEKNSLVQGVEKCIVGTLSRASGPRFSQHAAIRASDPAFDRIVHNLRMVLTSKVPGLGVIAELDTNGLGYNNLLFMATVLAELEASKEAVLPLLLVEEPEAHLHPQLQTLLADFLAEGSTAGDHKSRVQTIVTTHSPTVAAHVSPETIRVLHRSGASTRTRCTPLKDCGLSINESKALRRMLDVTKATLLFSRGVSGDHDGPARLPGVRHGVEDEERRNPR